MTTTIIAETQMAQFAIDTIRTSSVAAVQAANSGHPGTPTALAPQAFGASAPLKALMKEYGFTADTVVAAAKARLAPGQS